MKNAVIIDDERPALMELEYLLNKYEEIKITGLFSDPLGAIEAIRELRPDVVFLDINMPQMRGIDAASVILDIDPAIDIIFVTAFDQYAIEAFDLHALDYVLKPINDQRFDKTIQRILAKTTAEIAAPSQRFYIKCLGGFQIGWQGKDSIKWRADKTKEIFAYLLQHKEKDISKEELLDRLWPEDDPEKAIRQLYNGIYYIRKALEDYGVDRNMIKIDKDYHLKLSDVDLDVNYFYDYSKNKANYGLEDLEKLVDRYGGGYLQGEYYPWADFEREHLEKLYLKCISQLSSKLVAESQWDKAEEYLRKAYESNPYEEEISEILVDLYIQSGNKSKAIRHYNVYAELIKNELGVKPEQKLQTMINSIK
ncbi:MAG: response regulator [Clostridia bacterium]|nr:response regulator [Clostridia bacterium]